MTNDQIYLAVTAYWLMGVVFCFWYDISGWKVKKVTIGDIMRWAMASWIWPFSAIIMILEFIRDLEIGEIVVWQKKEGE